MLASDVGISSISFFLHVHYRKTTCGDYGRCASVTVAPEVVPDLKFLNEILNGAATVQFGPRSSSATATDSALITAISGALRFADVASSYARKLP